MTEFGLTFVLNPNLNRGVYHDKAVEFCKVFMKVSLKDREVAINLWKEGHMSSVESLVVLLG